MALRHACRAVRVSRPWGSRSPPARDWRRRFRARAPVLAAGFSSLAVALGAAVPEVSATPEVAALEALAGAWDQARRRFGDSVPGPFDFASAVTGGSVLATTTT